METQFMVVYIEGLSYQLCITTDHEKEERIYEVISSGNAIEQFMPEFIEWQEDSFIADKQNRILLIEQEQIARIIWTDLLNMMG